MTESTACVCWFWRLSFLLVPSFGRTVENFIHVSESWLLSSDDTRGHPLDSSQGSAHKVCLSVP